MSEALITAMVSAGALSGDELIEIVQGGINKKTTLSALVGIAPTATWGSVAEPWQPFTRQIVVATTGNNANAGTETEPVLTIARALEIMAAEGPGSEILIRAGTYQENSLWLEMDGTPAAWLAIRGWPGERPVVKHTIGSHLLGGAGAYLLFENLEIDGDKAGTSTSDATIITTRQDAIDWAMTQSSCYVTNENCQSGLLIDGTRRPTHHVIVRDVISHDFSGAGIHVKEADYLLIEDCRVYLNAYGDFFGQSGIVVYRPKDSQLAYPADHRTILRRNIAYGNHQYVQSTGRDIAAVSDGNGIVFDSGTIMAYPYRTLIENNIAFNNGGGGIKAIDSRRIDFKGNVAIGNSRHADHFDGNLYAKNCDDATFRGNTVVADDANAVNSDTENTNLASSANLFWGGAVAVSSSSDVMPTTLLQNII